MYFPALLNHKRGLNSAWLATKEVSEKNKFVFADRGYMVCYASGDCTNVGVACLNDTTTNPNGGMNRPFSGGVSDSNMSANMGAGRKKAAEKCLAEAEKKMNVRKHLRASTPRILQYTTFPVL